MPSCRKSFSQSGINLIEVALAIVLLGLVMGSCMRVYNQHQNQQAELVTRENMKKITKVLGNYVAIANRVPCPANPAAAGDDFGWESGADAPTVGSGREKGNCVDGNPDGGVRQGLVPYQVLNIPYETILDGWGRYISYAVSPVYTQNPDPVATSDDEKVLSKCREAGWVTQGPRNVNAPKARFCCSMFNGNATIASDIKLHKSTNTAATVIGSSPTGLTPREEAIAADANMNTVFSTASRLHPAPFTFEPAAIALISHGRNGRCAFRGNNTNQQIDCVDGTIPAEEYQNSGGDDLEGGPKTGNFDDIVYFMTPSGLMAAGGAASCAYP